MTDQENVLIFEYEINASASEIYKAFTNSTILRHWLCNIASVDAKENGRIFLVWENEYYTSGHYLEVIPDVKVSFTWLGKGEPRTTIVNVDIIPLDDKNLVRLTHTGLDNSPEWENNLREIVKGWHISLPNLVSILETGIDLRISQRPLIGIFPQPYNRQSDDDPFPLPFGMRIMDIVEGYSASEAGLKAGDILVELEGDPITDWYCLPDAIMHHKAGDVVNVTFYRGVEKIQKQVKLSSQIMPDTAGSPQELAKILSHKQADACEEMMKLLRQTTEEDASYKSGKSEWSIKEILAQLIHNERDMQYWISNMVQGLEPIIEGEAKNLEARILATIKLYPTLPQLIQLLRDSLKETVSFIGNLPETIVDNKATFWRLSYIVQQSSLMIRSHFDQIKMNLDMARNIVDTTNVINS